MNRYAPPILVIALGAVVLVASIAWPRLAPPSTAWTDQKAEAYAQASRRLHAAASAPETAENQGELQAAEQEYATLRAELDHARGGYATLSLVLQMLGVGIGLIGAVWLILRQNQAEDARQASRGRTP